jgi:hypothetical protein
MWPFRKKAPDQEPDDDADEPVEIIVTPLAGLVHELLAAGAPPYAVVKAVQAVEAEGARTEARVRAQMSAAMTAKREPDKPRVARPRNRVTKSRVTSVTTKAKRSRAEYMRTYRARRGLRVVTRDGVVTDTRDGGAA